MIEPLGQIVALQKAKPESKTESGLFIPESAQEKPVAAAVVAIGANVSTVKVGDSVIYKGYSSTDITFEDEDYLLVDVDDILAIVKETK